MDKSYKRTKKFVKKARAEDKRLQEESGKHAPVKSSKWKYDMPEANEPAKKQRLEDHLPSRGRDRPVAGFVQPVWMRIA